MTRWRTKLGALVVAVALGASGAGGEEKGALKPALDKIPGTTVEFTMLQLPPGQITLKDKEGHDKQVEVKATPTRLAMTSWSRAPR